MLQGIGKRKIVKSLSGIWSGAGFIANQLNAYCHRRHHQCLRRLRCCCCCFVARLSLNWPYKNIKAYHWDSYNMFALWDFEILKLIEIHATKKMVFFILVFRYFFLRFRQNGKRNELINLINLPWKGVFIKISVYCRSLPQLRNLFYPNGYSRNEQKKMRREWKEEEEEGTTK